MNKLFSPAKKATSKLPRSFQTGTFGTKAMKSLKKPKETTLWRSHSLSASANANSTYHFPLFASGGVVCWMALIKRFVPRIWKPHLVPLQQQLSLTELSTKSGISQNQETCTTNSMMARSRIGSIGAILVLFIG